jgi:hypothetical protein
MAKELQTRFPEVAVADHDIARWERGTRRPGPYYREKLCVLFQTTADKLGFIPQDVSFEQNGEKSELAQEEEKERETTLLQPCHTEMTRDILESAGPHPFVILGPVKGFREFMDMIRRQFIEALAKLGLTTSFGNLSLALVSSPTVDPEEYLAQCSFTIDTCWEWLSRGSYQKVEKALHLNVPTLTRFANTLSPFQGIAAGLAMQAKIMQVILATHKLDFVAREIFCAEAVRYGELSGNVRLYTTALHWQGNTYVYCYRQPQTAIPIFNNALTHIGDDALLSRSGICSLLSIAYAQEKTQDNYETKAREYAELARMTMPKHPELDPFYHCINFGQSELDQQEGKMYLHLAEKLPNRSYAQLAYDAFDKSTSKQALNQGYRGGALIKKADAARALGDMREFVTCMEEGLHIAIEIDSKRRISEADDIMGYIPEKWQRETAVQELQKDISHAIVIARR